MSKNNKLISVTGDVSIQRLQWSTHKKCNKGLSWQHYPHVQSTLKDGGALLLSKLVSMSTSATILAPQLQAEDSLYKDMLHSSMEMDLFPVNASKNNKTYRVKQFLGYSGPSFGTPMLLPILNDNENSDLVIIDDENNGFNSNEEFWPLAIKSNQRSPIILYKTNSANFSSPLWKHVLKNHIENTIVIINADDFRSQGVNISRGLSWEKTALDFVWQINNNPNLNFLSNCHYLIIPFGLEGAIYYKKTGETSQSRLFFLTNKFEGEFIEENNGKMYGLTSCFVAGLARAIVSETNPRNNFNSLDNGIREGIVAAQKYFSFGYGENFEVNPFPNPSIFTEKENDFIYKEHIQDVLIRNSNNPNCQSCWYIIKDKSSTNLSDIAYDIVKNGEKSALRFIPIAEFGNLKVVDRAEIEAYHSIKNLMTEYISTTKVNRPLSIAVFGTPGSGKSFGITEVASSISPNLIEKIDFNLSQFGSVTDLIAAFQRVRDLSLEGKLPLVFFDEFDSFFQGKLGWLKYFLAPMQDGVFRERESIHPIGKAIFVFAGGTSNTFKQFCGEEIIDGDEYKQFMNDFQNTKGPDFISRLRGYVNILGPNQTDEDWDQLFIIRRAMLLRSMLVRKTPHLINDRGEAQIDNGIVRAMLKVDRYKHETRSMEAIMEMSTLSSAKKWEQSHLPSKEQLNLHVDKEDFLRHLMQDTFYCEKTEKLAEDLHNSYRELNLEKCSLELTCMHSWDELDDEYKNSMRNKALHIPNSLRKIDYDVISVLEKPEVVEFSKRELLILADYEHKRWSLEKKEQGWTYGLTIDEQNKTHPNLVPWDDLPQEEINRIIEDMKTFPKVLANSYFKIEKLKYLCYCEVHGFNKGTRTDQ